MDLCSEKMKDYKNKLVNDIRNWCNDNPDLSCDEHCYCLLSEPNSNRYINGEIIDVKTKCIVCDKVFIRGFDLKSHMLKHTGERPHKCDVCKTMFRHRYDLKSHMLVHTGEKPIQCNVCGTKFKQTHSLRRHMLIHTGEKPHKCDVCS